MANRRSQDYRIRPLCRADRQAVRDICVACCWMGEYVPQRIPDEWIWAEFWTRYFTDCQPRHTWVVERVRDGAVVGYLTGTTDEARVPAGPTTGPTAPNSKLGKVLFVLVLAVIVAIVSGRVSDLARLSWARLAACLPVGRFGAVGPCRFPSDRSSSHQVPDFS